MIHAGVYYTPGSLKARFCLAGNQATKTFCDQNNIRYDTCGKMLVATSELEMARMRALWERTAANGLEREWLSAAELREREPNIIGLGGIFVPSSGIVSYRDVATAMANRFQAKGGEIIYHAEVSALTEHAAGVVIRTSQGRESNRYAYRLCRADGGSAGQMLGVEPGFIICPFRGEYFRLAPRHNRIVNHLIYPIPDPAMPFLGVHLTRMIDGSVTVGPNAVLALKREGYRKRDVPSPTPWRFPLRRHSPRTAKPSAFRAGRDEKLAVQKRLFAASTKVLPQPDRQRSPALAGRRAGAGGFTGRQTD